ncbi:MAG: hypothetical protein V9G63_10045 [Candidatus Competibacter sp.]|jgi:hypothetical protein
MPGTPGMTQRQRSGLDARQRIWNTVRVFKQVSIEQAQATAEVSASNAQKYLRALLRAGYLQIARPKQSGKTGGHAIYRLARNTGPRAPIVRTGGDGVYDPNQDVFYPFQAGGHD